jgi:chromosome segregation ATPase
LKAKYQILDHNYQGCTKYRDEYKHQLNAANKEIKKLKEDIVDYVIEKDDELEKARDWNKLNKDGLGKRLEKYYECNHCGYKVAHDTSYWGGCGFCKDGLMIEKTEEQKHPMYPIHWGGWDKVETHTIKSEEATLDLEKRVSKLEEQLKNIQKINFRE